MVIFSTHSLACARVILRRFEAIYNNVYDEYNPATLNTSRASMLQLP